jgi:hypothetical protein
LSESESNTTTATTTPPEWAKDVPEKFRRETPEATLAELAKGYTNAEKALSSRPKETPSVVQITKETSQAEVLNDDDGIEVVFAKAGVKIDEVVAKFESTGAVDADTYAKLKAKGLTKKMADQVISTTSREKRAIVEQVVSVAGGEDKLATVMQWAGTLPADDVAYYNERLSNPTKAKNAMKELVNAYNEANGGSGGQMVNGNTPSSGAGYADDAAYKKDMATLRRQAVDGKIDPALQAKVAKEAAKRRTA